MKLLTLVQKAPGINPSQRFRHEQWAPYLARDHNIHLEFEPFESPELSDVIYAEGRTLEKAIRVIGSGLRRLDVIRRAGHFDGVVVLREATLLGGAYIERAIARGRRIPLIYDFDDAIWVKGPSIRNGMLARVRMPQKTADICRLASVVTVGNEFLARYARQYNSHVHLVRTSIDLERFREGPEPGQPFTVGWTGSHSTLQHLETLRSSIDELGSRMPLRVRVVCDVAPAPFANAELDFVKWSPDTEASALQGIHVGVMPLPDTEAARGKCGCKALQYMAVGRPAIVAPVGINSEIVHDGVNGLHATTTAEWTSAMQRLATNPELRRTLGRAGKRTVDEGFSAEQSAVAFARAALQAVSTSS